MTVLPPLKDGPAQTSLADRIVFPGMLPREIAVFKAWLNIHGKEYDRAEYNVRVGTGFDPGPQYEQFARDMIIKNSQKRIDAVLWRGQQAYIVEVKERATPYIVGQLLSYKLLWMRGFPSFNAPVMQSVSAMIDSDTIYCMDQLGLLHDVVYVDLAGIPGTKS